MAETCQFLRLVNNGATNKLPRFSQIPCLFPDEFERLPQAFPEFSDIRISIPCGSLVQGTADGYPVLKIPDIQ